MGKLKVWKSFSVMMVLLLVLQVGAQTVFTVPTLADNPLAQKLIGADPNTNSDATTAGNYFHLTRFTAEQSGSVNELRIMCPSSGNVKLAIYADNNGEPGSMLNAVNTSTPVNSGWNTIPVSATAVTAGTTYWMAWCADNNGVMGSKSTTNSFRRFKPTNYSSLIFPGQAGAGFTVNTEYYDIITGWGQIITPTPALPPNPPAPSSNHPPTITSLTAEPAALQFASRTTLTCIASDQDGDAVQYRWEARDGALSGEGNRVSWTSPSKGGSYSLFVIASDGKGAESRQEIVIPVAAPSGIQTFILVPKESGTVTSEGDRDNSMFKAGDDEKNIGYRAFFSFNIFPLQGMEIKQARLKFINGRVLGDDPFDSITGVGGFQIMRISYGNIMPKFSTVDGSPFQRLEIYLNQLVAEVDVTPELITAVDNRLERFQSEAGFMKRTTNGNGLAQYVQWTDVVLEVLMSGDSPIPPPTPPPPTPPPPLTLPSINSFMASPSGIAAGASSVLRWSVSNATSITIDNGIGAVSSSGSRPIIPATTTTYTLLASNDTNNISRSVTVYVTPAQPTPPTPSFLKSGSYQVEAIYGSTIYTPTWTVQVTGNQITGQSQWNCCPGPRTDPLQGRIEGNRVIIERDCTGQGWSGECLQVYDGTLSGNVIAGQYTLNGGYAGPWKLYLVGGPTPTPPPPTPPRPSFPFTPPALPPVAGQKLLGLDTITHIDDNCLNNCFHLDRYIASQSGNINMLRVFCVTAGNIKLAIYADNNGEPGTLLNAVNTSTPVYAGWNSIPIASTTVTAGTNYWLAMNTESVILGAQLSTNNNAIRRYKCGVSYSPFTFPLQAGTGFNADSYICDIILGWGQIVTQPTPPTPPPPSTSTSLVAESRTATPNSVIQVPIRLNGASNIGSMNFALTYNPQVLKVNKIDTGALLSGALFMTNYKAPPQVRFGLTTSDGISGSGTMAYIEFQVIGAASSSSALTFSELSTKNTAGQAVAVASQSGMVTVAKDGKVKGDYNGDGKVTVVDVMAALKMSVQLLPEDLILDMDGDGKVTAADAQLILKMALGK